MQPNFMQRIAIATLQFAVKMFKEEPVSTISRIPEGEAFEVFIRGNKMAYRDKISKAITVIEAPDGETFEILHNGYLPNDLGGFRANLNYRIIKNGSKK